MSDQFSIFRSIIYTMPFIFHSPKDSIFDKKIEQLTQAEIKKAQLLQKKLNRSPFQYKINIDICKQHPFRKHNQIQQNQIQKHGWVTLNDKKILTAEKKKQLLLKNHQMQMSKHYFNEQSAQKQKKFDSKSELIIFTNKNCQQSPIGIHNSSFNKGQLLGQPGPSKQHKQKQDKNDESRLKFKIQQNPGPCYYQVTKDNSYTRGGVIMSEKIHASIPNKKQSFTLKSQPVHQNERDEFSFSYKDQGSAIFKESVKIRKKKDSYVSLLFSGSRKSSAVQKQTKAGDSQIDQEQYQFLDSKVPHACSYQHLDQFKQGCRTFNVKKQTIPKSLRFGQIPRNCSSTTFTKTNSQISQSIQNNTSSKQQKNAKAYKQKELPVFKSNVPRQVFSENKLGKQQFYYSPKNNMTDYLDNEIISRNLKFSFGSSLERFQKLQKKQDDPFKYSNLQKQRSLKHFPASASFKASNNLRRLFGNRQNQQLPSPDQYNLEIDSVNSNVEKELFKRLLKYKYHDQVTTVKEKKRQMNKSLAQKQKNMIDIETSKIKATQIDLDRYEKYQNKKKANEKENISFGSDKKSPIKRGISGREELDVYYETNPGWELKSFNRQYGYQQPLV